MAETKEAGNPSPEVCQPEKQNPNLIVREYPQFRNIGRRELFHNLAGRCLTLAILMADCAGNDSAIDHLLRAKDELNRRRR